MAQWRAEIFRLTNVERVKAGLPAFQNPTSALQSACTVRSQEIVTNFSHTRPNGTTCFTALDEAGVRYSTAGENILWATAGYKTPQGVVDGWMNSAGHRANILNANFTMLGIGYTRASGRDCYVQMFIRPR